VQFADTTNDGGALSDGPGGPSGVRRRIAGDGGADLGVSRCGVCLDLLTRGRVDYCVHLVTLLIQCSLVRDMG
jgi:hypothetical protein